MWIRQLGLGIFGFTAGIAVATGVFAFILVIGVVPRMIAKTQMADKTRMQETVISISVVTMGFLSVSPWLALYKAPVPSILAQGLLLLYGLGAGIFVGCVAAALAEIVKTLPIMFRRARLKKGLCYVLWAMALGKVAGSFFYFLNGYF